MDLTEKAKKLKQDLPAVFLALRDNDTPVLAKIMAGIVVGYAIPVLIIWGLLLWATLH